MTSQDPIVEALQQFSTCDVSDALSKIKYPNSGFLSNLTLWSPQRQAGNTRIVGPAYTVQYSLNGTDAPKHPTHYIDSAPHGAVIFISSPKTLNAVYGGLMSNRAQLLGAVGTVVDGRFRDVQEHRDLGFPVFAKDIGTAPPYEAVFVSGVNVSIKLQTHDQDVTIHPGDYIIGDANGVVCLPRELAKKAILLIRQQAEADLKIANDIRDGMTFTEASKKHRTALPKPEIFP